MRTLLLLALAASGYTAEIKGSDAHVRFNQVSNIHGPFKFYVPSRAAPQYVVPPEAVYQHWPSGASWVEASFPISLVGGQRTFTFTAVTVTADSEYLLLDGTMPHK